jgi:O-acetyl-ADP-ribose deacetylase (regulator of RNase III)
MESRIGERTLALVQGDITTVAADVIVNAANSSLVGGGGVDGAIHRVGGPAIMTDLERRFGRSRHCPTGDAVVSEAGRLPARWVIHAVGPVWLGGGAGEPALLGSAFRRSMALAAELGARTVTLPAISCGVYGYPLEDAARIAIDAVAEALRGATSVERATFVLFGAETYRAFAAALSRSVPGAAGR